MFLYAPELVLLFALPWCWRALPPGVRRLLAVFAPGSLLYYIFIASLNYRGGIGWGPRYLMPLLPVLFAASAFVLVNLWSRGLRTRNPLSGLIVFCCSVSLLAMFVNFTAAARLDAQVND